MTTTASNISTLSDTYDEALRYFAGSGDVNYALERLAADLKSHDIDYVVIGAQELIKFRSLPKDFAERLHPYVRPKFLELHEAVEQSKTD